MKTTIFLIALLLIPLASAADLAYSVQLQTKDNQLLFKSVDVIPLESALATQGEQKVRIIDFSQKILYQGGFTIPKTKTLIYFDDEGSIIGEDFIHLNDTLFQVELPYFANSHKIIFYDRNNTSQLEVDVLGFSQNVPREKLVASLSTPTTNESKTSAETNLSETQQPKTNFWLILLASVVLLILIIGFAYIIFHIKRTKV